MRSLFISLALVSLLSPFATASARASDEGPIKAQLDAFQTAWNKDDAVAMASVWADDGTLINPVGVYAKGRADIAKVFVHEHTGPFKATKYETSDVKVQWVSADVAIVDITANISGIKSADGAVKPDYPHHVTWVFVKKDGKWQAASARPYQFGKPDDTK